MRTIPSLSRTLVSASGLALATAMIANAPVARAQSFQGTVSSTVGSVSVVNGTNTTTVTVSSPSAVINWTPNDQAATGGPINFQATGTTATFTNNPSGTGNFAVLNRIVPVGSTRPIQFNGSVVSTLQGAAAGGVPGGTVFFYSPGGILLGASAVFNVGNLGLTTLNLANDASGNFDTSGDYIFQQATVAGAQVNVLSGAQINAPVEGSYVALVAPSVVNGGTINVNGSAALVAADAASITFTPSGLFDIQVDAGTSATGTVVANNGTITGPAASSFFHRVYMVAVAKNDAITMALGSGSTLGFDIAGAADVVGNAIVLSAGRDVIANAIGGPSPGGGSGLVSVIGGDANLTSNTTIAATGGINLTSSTAAGLDFASDVQFYADGASSSLSATAGGAVTVAGSFVMRSDIDPGHPAVGSIPQDLAIIATGGGTINFARDVVLSANGAGVMAIPPGTAGGTGMGGDVRVEASNGGQITIGGNLGLDAYGFGGAAQSSGPAGGNGIGGSASVLASGTSGSTISVLGDATINSSGFGAGGFDCFSCVSDGGIGNGGTVTIQASGANSIGIGGITTINALGEGGSSDSAIGGSGTGGSIDVLASDGGNLTVHALTANAIGRGGNGGTGAGSAQGGSIMLAAYGVGGGGATIAGQASLVADAFGAVAFSPGGVAASATGGTIFISARDEKFLTFGDALAASASATGGGGSAGSTAVTGGQVTLDAASAGLVTVALGTQLVAAGSGGFNVAPLVGSPGTGGLAQITFGTSGDIQLGSDLFISAVASGTNASGDALAGTGVGGTARIVGSGAGSLSVAGNTLLYAIGNGGAGSSGLLAQGADGFGGTAALSLIGAQADFGGALTLDTAGLGGNGATVSGRGLGGLAMVSLVDSTLNAAGDVYLGAIGSGANTLSTGTGGSGLGGSTSFVLANSTGNLATRLTLEATGFGGVGAGALTSAASGEGGSANLSVNAGALAVANDILLLANGEGGNGVIFGDGGVGTGGSITLTANGDSRGNSLISASSFLLGAEGFGGDGFGAGGQISLNSAANGTVGGNAQGGTIFINAAADGGTITGTSLLVRADAEGGFGGDGFASSSLSTTGGSGGNGGSAQGGSITLDTVRGTGTGSGALNFADVSMNAFARGQSGGAGAIGTTRGEGGNGGSATGGTVTFNVDRGGSQLLVGGRLSSSVVGFGGDGGLCDPGCLAAGGDATGGSIFLGSNGATTGNVVTVGNGIDLTAAAYGGPTPGAAGGHALGGNVVLRSDTGLTLSADALSLDAISFGGDAQSAGAAGTARGGDVLLMSAGTGTVNVAGSTYLSTQSTGGAGLGETTAGGNGIGGVSRIVGQGGTLDLQGDAFVLAVGFGGAGNQGFSSGIGGDGFGGLAALTAGEPTILGNGSAITIGGQTLVSAEGSGGDAFTAGSGFGGEARIYARQGSLALGSVTISAGSAGGFGTSGGSGGAGNGGTIEVVADNAIEGPSLIAFTQLIANASAGGGAGSFTDASTMTGGNGGAAAGGSVLIAGGAGNGVLQGGSVTALAVANGGEGGDGNGASGGNGGSAVGGAIRVGSISGVDTGSLNVGTATYAGITALAGATGGAGGSGSGASSTATGGNGGSASGGSAGLLVRGSQVTVSGSGFFLADATGGAGGIGSVDGAGGSAVIGSADPARVAGAHLLITNRVNQPTQPGILAAGDLTFLASATGGTGSIAGASTNAGGAVSFTAIGSSLTANSIAFVAQAAGSGLGAAPEPITFLNATGTITGGFQFTTNQTVSLTLDQSSLLTDHAVIAGANWVLDPVAPVTIGTLTGTNSLVLSSGLDLVAYANLSTQGFLSLHAIGRIDLGTLAALGFVEATAGSTLSLDDVSSGDYIDLTALGAITTGNLIAASSITAETQGSVSTGNIAAGTGTPTGGNADLYSVGIRSGGNVSTGTIFAASDLGIAAAGTIMTGQATAYDMLLLGGGNIATGGLSATNRILIADVAMAALGQTANGFDKELVFAAVPVASTAGAIAISGPVSATAFTAATQSTFAGGAITVMPSTTGSGQLLINAGGALSAGNLFAANAINLRSAVSIQAGSVLSQNGTATFAAPTISTGAVQSASGISVSGQTVTTGNLGASAGSIDATGTQTITTGSVLSQNGTATFVSPTINLGAVQAAGGVSISGQTVTTGSLATNGGSVSAIGTQTIATGAITAAGSITVSGGSQTAVQSASATNGFVAVTSAGSLAIGNVDASAGTVRLLAGTPAANGGLVAGQGTINAGAVQAAGLVQVAAGGAVTTGSLRSNADGVKVVSFGGAVSSGQINARTDVLVSGMQSVNITGVINARDVALLSGGNVSTRSVQAGVVLAQSPTSPTGVTVTSATGRVLIANASMALPNLLLAPSTDYNALFAATPIRIAGTVNISGQIVAGRFVSFSQGDMTGVGAIGFGSIEVESGGLVTVGQRWGSPSLSIASADIRIIDNGALTGATGQVIGSGLRTSDTGEITLISLSGSPALIGDGLTGSGYSLSNAEIGLISGHQLTIGAVDVASNPIDMLIGNLTLTAGSTNNTTTLNDPGGFVQFITGNRNTQTPGGAIRIVGNVTGTGFASTNIVEFTTGRFELDAATGSLSLTQSGTTLGGTVEIAANAIHIASGAILDRLATDPFYNGHIADLNRPASVQRPGGVLRALGLDLFPTGTLYIQNTGTTLDPAGFFADFEFTDLTPPANAAPASISVIVNGKWQTAAGIVSGFAARDLVVNSADTLAFYTADSSVNGCAINASACVPEMVVDPVPAISSQIEIMTSNVLGDTPEFSPEPPADEEREPVALDVIGPVADPQAREEPASEADVAASPIAPPIEIIDSNPLDPQSLVEQPVAGSGNPSLIGSVVNEDSAEGEAQ